MSSTIDKRVVEMRFDNQQFETNAGATMGTLEKLKNALNFKNAGSGLDNLNQKVKGTNFSPLSSAVESVQVKFSAMEIAAVTALTNIVNRAVDTGIQLVKSLSIDQISAGFSEYELKMGSIQTIMAGTGEDLDTVNQKLDELNTYADKTIYSFSDMTSNIGKFTNAGVKLDDAVSAIQGVSNVAAVSGANANEASRAMYNFAQALSAGYVKLIDWKSIENANMATVEFKQQLLDTALAMGTVRKEGDKYVTTTTDAKGAVSDAFDATSMFNDSLSHQWMTTDVLVQALSNYSTDIREMSAEEVKAYEDKLRAIGYTEDQIKAIEELGQKAFDSAQDVKTFTQLMDTLKESVGSGWAQTFEIIFGDFEEAKSMWRSVNDVVGGILQKQADARNDLLKKWKEMGGRDMLMKSFVNIYEAFVKISEPVKRAFQEIFPPMTAQRLIDITARFRDFTKTLAPSSTKVLGDLRKTFLGVFSVFGLIGDVIKEVFGFFKELLLPVLGDGAKSILNFTGNLGENIKAFREWLKQNNYIRKGLEAIKSAISKGLTTLKNWFNAFKELPWVQEWTEKVKSKFSELTQTIRNKFPNAAKKFDELVASFRTLWRNKDFSKISGPIKEFASALKEDLLAAWEKVKSSELFTKFVDSMKAIWESIKNIDTKKISGWMKTTYESIKEFLQPAVDLFKKIKDKLFGYATSVRDGTMSIADALRDGATWIKEHIGSIIAALAIFITARTVVKFISKIWKVAEALAAPVTTIVDAFNGFAQAAKGLKSVLKATALLEAALAIGGLALIVVEVGKADGAQIAKGLTVVGLVSLFVAGVIAALGYMFKHKSTLSPKSVKSQIAGMFKMIELAGAVMLLVAAFGDLADTISKYKNDPKTLEIALGGIVGSIVVLVGITYVLKKIGPVDTKGISGPILSIAAAVYILVQAFSDIIAAITAEGVTTEDVERATATLLSLTGLMGVIAILLAAVSKIPTSGSSLKIGGGVFAVALSVKVLVGALDDIMNLDFEKIKGSKDTLVALAAIAGTLVLLMVAISKMPATAGMNGVGLFAAAASIEILAIAVKTMSSLDAGDIARGVIAIGAMLIFLGLFTKLTRKGSQLSGKSAIVFLALSGTILILAGAVALLSLLKPEDVIIGTAAISTLVTSVGLMMLLSSKSSGLKLTPFIGISLVVGVLTAAIYALSLMDQGAVVTGTLALSALMICVGFMAGLMSVCDNLKLGSFVGLSLVILALAGSIRMIGELEDGVAKAVVAMGVMMVLFGLLSKMLSTAAVTFNEAGPLGLVGVGICILVLAACAGVVAALVNLGDVDSVVTIALSLGVLMAAVGIAMQGVAAVGQLGEGGGGWEKLGIGLVGLVAVIGVIALLIAGVVALNEYVPGAQQALDEALPLFNSIGKALGEVVGGFLEGLLGIDTKGLTQQITDFGDGMKNFSDSASGISDEAANGVKAIAAMLLALAGSDLMNAITGLLGGKVTTLTEFSAQLPGFGADMAAFAKALGSDFKPEIVEGAGEAGKSLATMVKNLPTTGGWKEKILGTPESMESFSSSVMTFATLLKDLSSEENGIGGLTQTDIDKIELMASAGEKLIDLQGKLPASGGFLQTILGEQTTLDTFGGQLVSFAGAVRKLASPVVGFGKFTKDDVDHMGYAADAAGKLVDLQEALPDEAGWLSKFFGGGQQDLESFGNDAVAFAGSLRKVLSEDEGFGGLSDTSKDCIDTVTDVVNALKGFIAANEGEEAFDSSGIKTLGDDIKSFGKNFNSFYDYIDDIDATFLTSIVSEITNLINTLSSGLDSTSVSTFSDSLSTLASTGITNFCNEFTNSNPQLILAVATFMDVAIAAINSNNTLFSDAGKSSIASYINEFDNNKDAARREARDFIAALTGVFSSSKQSFKNYGKELVTTYIDGIRAEVQTDSVSSVINGLVTKASTPLASAKNTALTHGRSFSENFVNGIKLDASGNWYQQQAYDAASALASWAVSAISNMYRSGEVQGHNFSTGFINGIYYDVYKRSYSQQAFNAAYNIGDSAVKGLRTGINAHSPSRKSQAAADDFGIGFTARLMSKWAKNAGEAGGELGSEAVDSLNEAIRKIPDMLTGDIDMSPVITPTIDLTNARASADLLNAMFNQSVKTSASMANITGASINSASRYASAYADQQNTQAQAPSLTVENHNQFNITSDNPTEVANRVSYILQKQVERKESVWARSSGTGSPLVQSR